jgi:hypothetical protein
MAEKRYTGIVTHQMSGRSWVKCDEFEALQKFFTIDAEGNVEIGSTVTFELDHQYPGFDGAYWWVQNVRVFDPRDAKIAELEARVADLEEQLYFASQQYAPRGKDSMWDHVIHL